MLELFVSELQKYNGDGEEVKPGLFSTPSKKAKNILLLFFMQSKTENQAYIIAAALFASAKKSLDDIKDVILRSLPKNFSIKDANEAVQYFNRLIYQSVKGQTKEVIDNFVRAVKDAIEAVKEAIEFEAPLKQSDDKKASEHDPDPLKGLYGKTSKALELLTGLPSSTPPVDNSVRSMSKP